MTRHERSAPPHLGIRRADIDDAEALGDLYLSARAAAYPAIPRAVHPDADVRRWVAGRVTDPEAELWLAEEDGALVALLLLEGDWVHSLYVAPDRTGAGIGSALLDLAKSLRVGGLGLWVFESNHAARRFYRRHGFRQVRRTDGADNEEGAPDLELAWSGADRTARRSPPVAVPAAAGPAVAGAEDGRGEDRGIATPPLGVRRATSVE